MSEAPQDDPAVREALVAWSDAHRDDWARAIEAGDRATLRALYEELGDLLAGVREQDPESRTVLSQEPTNRIIRAFASRTHGSRVLDVGCGPTPVASIAFAKSGNHVVGLDVALSIVRLARESAAPGGGDGVDVRARFLVGDAERLPFSDGGFDVATCDDTIEHLVAPARAIGELGRVIRPGGRLLLISPNHGGLHVVAMRLREALRGRRHPRRWYHVTDSHAVEFRWRELRRLLGPSWRLERAYPLGFSSQSAGWRAASRAVRLGPLWRLSSALVLVLRRTAHRPRVAGISGPGVARP